MSNNEPEINSKHIDYLKFSLGMKEAKARTYVLSRMGYSTSGISKHVSVTEGTVKKYLDDIEGKYGREAVYARSGKSDKILEPLPEFDEINDENQNTL